MKNWLYQIIFQILNRNVRDFILPRKDQIKFFNTIHSYSQLVLLPWGNSYYAAPGIDKMQGSIDWVHEPFETTKLFIYFCPSHCNSQCESQELNPG